MILKWAFLGIQIIVVQAEITATAVDNSHDLIIKIDSVYRFIPKKRWKDIVKDAITILQRSVEKKANLKTLVRKDS